MGNTPTPLKDTINQIASNGCTCSKYSSISKLRSKFVQSIISIGMVLCLLLGLLLHLRSHKLLRPLTEICGLLLRLNLHLLRGRLKCRRLLFLILLKVTKFLYIIRGEYSRTTSTGSSPPGWRQLFDNFNLIANLKLHIFWLLRSVCVQCLNINLII